MILTDREWMSVRYKPVPRDRMVIVTNRGSLAYTFVYWSEALGCFAAPRFMACDLVGEFGIAFWSEATPLEIETMREFSNMCAFASQARAQRNVSSRVHPGAG